jgi:hydrogenase expression/formation protein HypC
MCLAARGLIVSIAEWPSEAPPSTGRSFAGGMDAEAGNPQAGSSPPWAGAADGPVPPDQPDPLWRVAEVDFGGVRQQVSLACLPEARVGDRVLVHVGLALSLVEEEEA